MKKEISVKMENCECVIGKSTKKHNTVSMRVSNKDIIEVLELYEAEKRGEKPEDGIIGLRLVAVYAEEQKEDAQKELPVNGEDLVDQMNDELDGVLEE